MIQFQPSAAVGRRLRDLRVARGVTLERLAKQAGLRASALLDIEQGRARPSLDTLGKIAQRLGTSVFDLVKTATRAPVPSAGPALSGLDPIAQAILELPEDFGDKLDAVDAAVVRHAMTVGRGNQSEAARLLGMERKALVRRWAKIKRGWRE